MPRIYQARIFKTDAGFSLIEVIVAVAVVAMTVAAASSSILISRKVEAAAFFYRDAVLVSADAQAAAYGLSLKDDSEKENARLTVEQETITSDPGERTPVWVVYTIRSREADRRITFALKTGSGE